jgi:hypothetical protein
MVRALSLKRSLSSNSLMTADELRSSERILARLVAAAYAADHPELFDKDATDHRERGERNLEDIPALTSTAPGTYPSGSRDHQLRQTTDGP